jgi:hypothetical protein
MRSAVFLLSGLSLLALLFAQRPEPGPPRDEDPGHGLKRSQVEEILKQDHRKSIDDAAQLIKLSEELKIELEKNDRHVLSVAAMKKTEEIEKLAKRIRGRMKRF